MHIGYIITIIAGVVWIGFKVAEHIYRKKNPIHKKILIGIDDDFNDLLIDNNDKK